MIADLNQDEQMMTGIQSESQFQYNYHPQQFEEVDGGFFDPYGFYILPDGSFWDPHGIYFNRDGLDSNGGFYDDNFNYIPGSNWNEELGAYIEPVPGFNQEIQEKIIRKNIALLYESYMKNRNIFEGDNLVENQNEMDMDNSDPLIESLIEGNLIQNDVPYSESQNLNYVKQTQENQEETFNPSKMIDEDMERLGTPFKVKSCDVSKQGTPFTSMSVKKMILTSTVPKENAGH